MGWTGPVSMLGRPGPRKGARIVFCAHPAPRTGPPLEIRNKVTEVGLSFALEEPPMKPEQSTLHLVSANLGRWLGPGIPDLVVARARAHLRTNDTARRLRGAWVLVFGDDLHLHLTTYN